jgi:hypothetical protein
MTGSFGTTVTTALDGCSAEIQSKNTLEVLNYTDTEKYLTSLLDNYPGSEATITADSGLHLSLATNDLLDHFSQRKNFDDGHYELKFFVGMAYITLLPAPVLSTAVSDVVVTISVSPALTFAFSSQQKYTVVQYLTMSLQQNKWYDTNLVLFTMQFVSIGVVLPANLFQNMDTGLIPLSSIRFAIATSMPDKNDDTLWTNPCYSGDGTGMYDDESATPWENMYTKAAAQDCAFGKAMCTNPIGTVMANRLVSFHFPIGDTAVTEAIQNAGTYHLFAMFSLSILDSAGASIITEVFTSAPITRISMGTGCEKLNGDMSLAEMTEVDIAVGLVGTEALWDTSIALATDVMHSGSYTEVFDTGVQHNTLASSLVTVVVKAKQILQDTNDFGDLTLTMDYLTSMHFLDNDKYNQVITLIWLT